MDKIPNKPVKLYYPFVKVENSQDSALILSIHNARLKFNARVKSRFSSQKYQKSKIYFLYTKS